MELQTKDANMEVVTYVQFMEANRKVTHLLNFKYKER